MKALRMGLFTVVVAVGAAGVGSVAAADDASLVNEAIFDPSITVSQAPHGLAPLTTVTGLVINPTFDTSITSDPNAATIMSTINAAIAVYEARFSDPITVSIKFKKMSSGLGLSQTVVPCASPCTPSCGCGSIPYGSYLAALSTDAPSSGNDVSALATLPGGAYNPVNGNTNVWVKTANLRALGFVANPPVGQPDSTISLNTSICNLDRLSINPSKYDLMAVVSHEIDEALGLGSVLPGSLTGPVFPEDLFRYDQANNRSFNTTSTSQAFFSIDGTTQLARFNQGPGGDFGDWYSTGPHTPQVQDAFATAGATPDLGVELTALDVIGYGLVAAPTPPPTPTPTQVGFCGGMNGTCTPTATPEDSGFVPPNQDVAKCEAGVANNVRALKSCIRKCHIKAAAAVFNMTFFDEEACETTDPMKSCRAKYDKKQVKLLAKGTCPACLDAAHQANLADQAEADLDAGNGALFCAGTVPLAGDDTGFVAPDANKLKCETGVAKNASKHEKCVRKCHIKAAAAAFKLKPFDEEACEETDPKKSCRAKYAAKQATLLTTGNCPGCLDAAHQAALADQAEIELDNNNDAIYCAGTNHLPGPPPTATATATPTVPEPFVRALAIDPSTPSTLYAGTNTNGVFRSTNSGGSWSAINTGLFGGFVALAIDPSTPSTLYAGGNDLFQSTNSGGTWSAANTGLSSSGVYALAIDPSTPSTLYAGTGADGVYKSTNSGGNWSAVNTGLSGLIVALAIDPSTPSTLYAGTANGVYQSTNSGGSWSAVNTGLSGAALLVNALVIDPSTPSTLYAGGNNGGGVYRSTNSGGSWSAINTGLSGGALFVEALVIDPSTPSTLYAGTDGGGVYQSTNSGGNWSAANTGLSGNALLVAALVIDPSTPSTLYAGTDEAGVYQTTNSGGSWSAVNTGF